MRVPICNQQKKRQYRPPCRLFQCFRQRHVPTLWRYCFVRFDTTSFQEIILSSGFFRRETAIGFYPWGNVEGPRKRVAEGLCGWRHGNSFPMTQSAQSHRQMRSIPLCPKAVFYVFVFDSIHDSATIHIYPQKFSTDHQKGILLIMPKKPINKNQGEMDRSEIHGIDFRFSTFGGGSLVWWQN